MTGVEPTERARTDEQHRLAVVHPRFDGFLVVELEAHVDLDDARAVPVGALAEVLTPHHAVGPLYAGQVRPMDLELHPGAIARPAMTGLVRFLDDDGTDVCAPLEVTLATDVRVDCVLAGALDGPWEHTPATFADVVHALLSGERCARQVARRVERVQAGADDPVWRMGIRGRLGL